MKGWKRAVFGMGAALCCLLAVTGCGRTDASAPQSVGSGVDENSLQTVTGRYCRANGQDLILCDNGDPIVLGGGSDAAFRDLQTGDRIEILCDSILETYPAQTAVYDCKLLERGTGDDLPADTVRSLSDLGWHIEDPAASASE